MGTLVKEDENTISDGDIRNTSPSCRELNISQAHSRYSRKTVPTSNAWVQTDCQTSQLKLRTNRNCLESI